MQVEAEDIAVEADGAAATVQVGEVLTSASEALDAAAVQMEEVLLVTSHEASRQFCALHTPRAQPLQNIRYSTTRSAKDNDATQDLETCLLLFMMFTSAFQHSHSLNNERTT